MAKNELGELENAPGAQRRASAHAKRLLVKSSRKLAEEHRAAANDQLRRGNVMQKRFVASQKLHKDEREHPPWEYTRAMDQAQKEATEHFSAMDRFNAVARQNKWGARVDTVVATYQTVKAKLGF